MKRLERKNQILSDPLFMGVAASISLLAQYGLNLNPGILEFFRYVSRITAVIITISFIPLYAPAFENIIDFAKEAK